MHLLLGKKIMSDGISQMMYNANEQAFIRGVEKLSQKDIEEVYVMLKDIDMDIQNLYYDERLQLTRNQWAAISRLYKSIKELV